MASKQQSQVTKYIIQGLQQQLGETFGLSNPKLVMTNFPLQYFLTAGGGYRADNQEVQYPYTYIRPIQIGKDVESYPARVNANRPAARRFAIPDSSTNEAVTVFNILPIVFTFEFGYISDDPMTFLQFCADWVFHSAGGNLNFGVAYKGVHMDVRVALDDNWTIPEKDDSPEQQTQVLGVSQITVKAYITGREHEMSQQELNPRPVYTFGVMGSTENL